MNLPAEIQKVVEKNGCIINKNRCICYKNIWIADYYDVYINDNDLYDVAFMSFENDKELTMEDNNDINWHLSNVLNMTIQQIDEKLNELVQIIKKLEIKRKINRIDKDF